MLVEIEVPDEIAKILGDRMRMPKPGDDRWEKVRKSIIYDHEAVRATAQVLLQWAIERRLQFVPPGEGEEF